MPNSFPSTVHEQDVCGDGDPTPLLRIGVIGTSPGNGHPYSWSALFNGYDKALMAACPFDVIPAYLSKHVVGTGVIPGAKVTHIWTQNPDEAAKIASTCLIPHVSGSAAELVSEVDAVLVARDDPDSHPYFVEMLTRRDTPGLIDKPFAVRRRDAEEMWALDPGGRLLFTCSGLRYAPELQPFLGREGSQPMVIRGVAPKSWDLYSIHIIEPALRMVPLSASATSVRASSADGERTLRIDWSSGQRTEFRTTGDAKTPISIEINGERVVLQDTYHAFKSAMEAFVAFVRDPSMNIEREETLRVIDLVERGRE